MVKLIIDDPNALTGFELIDSSIVNTPEYKKNYERIKKNYLKLLLEAEHWEYREYQPECASIMSTRRRNILNYDMGTGKAQPLSATVYCPEGAKRIGELVPGDVVLTPSGGAKVKSIHPQGLSTIYRIIFSDNSSTLCTSSHLWSVYHCNNLEPQTPLLATTEAINLKLSCKDYRLDPFAIPLCNAISFSSLPVPISPYHLGCIISETYLCEYSLSAYYSLSQLSASGIRSFKPEQKFIPKQYLFNSSDIRILLLQGLFDSNSTIVKDNDVVLCVLYTTKSKTLADDIKFLVQSLGGTCTTKKNNQKYNFSNSSLYTLSINLPSCIIPFKDPSKVLEYKNVIEPRRVIKRIVEEGVEEAVCIKLDNEEGLYLTDEFIVTHNTTICGLAIEDYCIQEWGDLSLAPPGAIQIFVPNLLSSQRWLQDLSFFKLKNFFSIISSKSCLPSTSPILICTLDLPKQIRHKSIKCNFMSDYLVSLKPHMVIIDEVHNCQHSSERTRQLSKIVKHTPRVTALSGTLSEGRLSDIHHLCSFIYPEWPYTSPSSFSKHFGSNVKLPHYLNYDSSKSKTLQRLNPFLSSEYKHLLDNYIHRLSLLDPFVSKSIRIPTANVEVSGFPPTKEQLTVHREYLEKHYSLIKRVAEAQVTSFRDKAEALTIIYPLIMLCDANENSPKLHELERIVNKSNRTAIFTAYKKSGRLVTEFLKSRFGSERVLRLYSTDEEEEVTTCTPEQRVELVDQFMLDPAIKAGVFSIKLAGESINLTSADCVVLFGLPWQIKTIKQAIYRAVRPGNTARQVNIHFLYHYGLFDEYQVRLASEKVLSSISCENFYSFTSNNKDAPNDTSFDAATVLKNLIA